MTITYNLYSDVSYSYYKIVGVILMAYAYTYWRNDEISIARGVNYLFESLLITPVFLCLSDFAANTKSCLREQYQIMQSVHPRRGGCHDEKK